MSETSLHERLTPLILPDVHGASATRQGLQRLLLLRALVTAASVGGALIFISLSELHVPLTLIGGLSLAIVISILLGVWRLNHARVIASAELCGQLALDLIFLCVTLFYTGGAGNPLISYLLVLLAVAATLLRQAQVNVFAAVTILIYTAFLIGELQGGQASNEQTVTFQLHLVGMWVTFVVSAVLITAFITRMAAGIRSRESTLAQARENEMRNEQLVAIGTLAAGTAHALGTPLSTMSVLLGEMERQVNDPEHGDTVHLADDIALLRQQVARCRESLNHLTRVYHKADAESDRLTLEQFCDDIQDYIVNVQPHARVSFEIPPEAGHWLVAQDMTLKHAVINVIENAIKAASSAVRVTLSIEPEEAPPASIIVRDDGPGIPESVMEQLGEPFISSRSDSMGLGIFLANAAVQRGGGAIEMFNLREGGAMTVIRLPAESIEADSDD